MEHKIPHTFFFPHLIQAKLNNGTIIDSNNASPCWMVCFHFHFREIKN